MQPMMRYDEEEEEDNDDHVSKDGLHFHLALLMLPELLTISLFRSLLEIDTEFYVFFCDPKKLAVKCIKV